jgi:hypothetical protein
VVFSIIRLFWQLFVLSACCSGAGLALRCFIPKEFSLLKKALYSFMGGLYLVVLVPQNLVYLGVPVRISAWLLLAVALLQIWLTRHNFATWVWRSYSNGEIRTLAVLILLTVTFHGIVPIRQGLELYYGKGYDDQLNYVLLAEFLKEEPYSTSSRDIGLRPWLVRPVGFQGSAEELGMSPGPGLQIRGLKKERIGQSIITAEIGVWSGTDGKGGYAATVIFFITLLPFCLYAFLRETGINRFMAGSGALLTALLPALTRLSLNGFLSQVSVLFVFPFFASLLRSESLSPRNFTLFFSLTLAYVVAAYSEIAPIGLGTLFLGVMFVRRDTFRSKRLMLMSAILLVALLNCYYLQNLIGFLWQQYSVAANAAFLDNLAPNVLTLRGWSELIYGATSSPFALLFDYCAILLGLLFLAGAIFSSRRDKLIYGAILLPVIFVVLYLTTRKPHSYYAIAKLTLTILPFLVVPVFVALSKFAANNRYYPIRVLIEVLSAITVAAAAAGSARYYSEVLNNQGLLRFVRDPRFLNVCHELDELQNKRVLLFETNPWLTGWLSYHARHNNVYFDRRYITDPSLPPLAPFLRIPDLENLDFVATRDRIVDLRAPNVSCLTLVDDISGEDRQDGHDRYWLGPPAVLRFLALQPLSANLKMQLVPGPEATTLPIHYSLADDQGHVAQGEIWRKDVDVRRMSFPQGPSYMRLSVKGKESDSNTASSFPILAELDNLEVTDIELKPKK